MCQIWHLTASSFWDQTQKLKDIEGSVRHNTDPIFGQLCAVIRSYLPSQQQIDQAPSRCACILKNEIPNYAAPTSGAGANASDLSTNKYN